MAKTFKALSALLGYPSAELVAAMPEIREVLRRERIVPARELAALEKLLGEMEVLDLYELQERYVELFDRSRALSLHLFEHIHGESRDRGQAMVDLAELYHRHGFQPLAGELPDYLPLLLEFLSLVPPAEAKKLLADSAHITGALTERLTRRNSPYAAVLAAIGAIADANNLPASDQLATTDIAAGDLEALDAEWEEAAVTFGPESALGDGCGRSRLMSRLRAAARSVTAPPSRLKEDA